MKKTEKESITDRVLQCPQETTEHLERTVTYIDDNTGEEHLYVIIPIRPMESRRSFVLSS